MLADASALVAMLDATDANHGRITEALQAVTDPLYSVWPALTEAMHLLSDDWRGPEALCDMIDDGVLGLRSLDHVEFGRVKELLRQYRDLPMDFADAALVRVAERDGIGRILTFDHHFRIYRLPRRRHFEVIP